MMCGVTSNSKFYEDFRKHCSAGGHINCAWHFLFRTQMGPPWVDVCPSPPSGCLFAWALSSTSREVSQSAEWLANLHVAENEWSVLTRNDSAAFYASSSFCPYSPLRCLPRKWRLGLEMRRCFFCCQRSSESLMMTAAAEYDKDVFQPFLAWCTHVRGRMMV